MLKLLRAAPAVLRGETKCKLIGGPMDGWTGGFIDTQQSSAAFPHSGAEKGCYVYVRAQQSRRDRRNPDAAVPFVYDVRESDRRLRALCLIGPFDTTGDVKR